MTNNYEIAVTPHARVRPSRMATFGGYLSDEYYNINPKMTVDVDSVEFDLPDEWVQDEVPGVGFEVFSPGKIRFPVKTAFNLNVENIGIFLNIVISVNTTKYAPITQFTRTEPGTLEDEGERKQFYRTMHPYGNFIERFLRKVGDEDYIFSVFGALDFIMLRTMETKPLSNSNAVSRICEMQDIGADDLLKISKADLLSFSAYVLWRVIERRVYYFSKTTVNQALASFFIWRDGVKKGHDETFFYEKAIGVEKRAMYVCAQSGIALVVERTSGKVYIKNVSANNGELWRILDGADVVQLNKERKTPSHATLSLSKAENEYLKKVLLGVDATVIDRSFLQFILSKKDEQRAPALLFESSTNNGTRIIAMAQEMLKAAISSSSFCSSAQTAARRARRIPRTGNIFFALSEKVKREIIATNPLIKEITLLGENTVRVILEEPIQPTMLTSCGRTFVEDIPGTVLRSFQMKAFEMSMMSPGHFPLVRAFSDDGCSRPSNHPNIGARGEVCLGDINNSSINATELAARGGISTVFFSEFLQMLRQCNLDSAYNSNTSFILKNPGDAINWRRSNMEIAGMSLIQNTFTV